MAYSNHADTATTRAKPSFRVRLLTAAVVLWCLLPQVALVLGGTVANTPLVASLAWATAGCGLVLALASRLWLGLTMLWPFAVLAPVELWYVTNYGRPSDAHVLGVISETNVREAAGFVGGELALMLALVAAGGLLAASAIVAARRSRLRWTLRGRLTALALSGLALAPPLISFAADSDPLGAGETPQRDGLELAQGTSTILVDMAATFPTGVPWRLAHYWHHQQTLKSLNQRLGGFRFGARATSPADSSAQRIVHVLVIGETGRPDRWQLNGYARPTSPRLAAEPDVVSFTNMISPWAWTRMAVPVMLSRKPGDDDNPFFPERSLITAFKEAGYRTYWLSTQSPLGTHDSSIGLVAGEAHESRYLNPADYKAAGVHDDALLPVLDQVLARDEPRQLIVLHTLGSHYNYGHRYPARFERFTPSLTTHPRPNLHDPAQAALMSNAYDNSVLFTDDVLAEVIARLRALQTPATLLYAADHGENLFDEGCALSGHGHFTERDFRIASLFWASPSYQQLQPRHMARARSMAQARLSTTQIFPTMMALASIQVDLPDRRGTKAPASLLDQEMPLGSRRVQQGRDFDLATREGACKKLGTARALPH